MGVILVQSVNKTAIVNDQENILNKKLYLAIRKLQRSIAAGNFLF
ncbi:hypothetical protein RV03_GL002433 [Enterococcus gallinarum]|nr:hypothetical protein RV03_GL002433 [Enterococcus gallinarum]